MQSADKNTVYLATRQGLAKTVNFLAEEPSWTFPVPLGVVDSSKECYAVHIDSRDANVIYIGTIGGNIYRSPDAGGTWTEVSPQSGADLLDFEQAPDGTLYAAYGERGQAVGGVYASSDGIVWNDISAPAFDAYANTLAMVGSTLFVGVGNDQQSEGLGIWKYADSQWSAASGDVANYVVADLLAIGDVIIAATVAAPGGSSGRVFRSPDAGVTWKDVTTGGLLADNAFYRTLAVNPEDTNLVYVAHGNPAGAVKIYKSGDKGLTWNEIYSGLVDEVPQAMLVDGLLAGFNTGLFGLAQSKASLRLAYVRPTLRCTLKVNSRALTSQYILIEKKAPRKRIWSRAARARTNSRGVVTYSAKKLAAGTLLRCNWAGQKSATVRK